jgi:hypothetical protein
MGGEDVICHLNFKDNYGEGFGQFFSVKWAYGTMYDIHRDLNWNGVGDGLQWYFPVVIISFTSSWVMYSDENREHIRFNSVNGRILLLYQLFCNLRYVDYVTQNT